MHDAFDGERFGCFRNSRSHHNVYEHNWDNHIEMECWGAEYSAAFDAASLEFDHSLLLAGAAGPISHDNAGANPGIAGPQLIHHNVVYGYDDSGWRTWTIAKSNALHATQPISFVHNVLWTKRGELFYLPDNLEFKNNILIFTEGISADESFPATTPQPVALTNLLVNDTSWPSITQGPAALYLGPWPNMGSWAHFGADPLDLESVVGFVDVSNLNFGLTSTSPAINLGTIISGFNDDPMEYPDGPDIGAFEFGSDPGPDWPRPRRTVFDCSVPERWNNPLAVIPYETLCLPAQHDCCQQRTASGCGDPVIEACVCATIPACCNPAGEWDYSCAEQAVYFCNAKCVTK